ncbi:hypothetical protein FRC05_000725 [Tulasnella sp. 425]|nr:hypothetical protein FRC05_000725 [Tulasnella sp. 425]
MVDVRDSSGLELLFNSVKVAVVRHCGLEMEEILAAREYVARVRARSSSPLVSKLWARVTKRLEYGPVRTTSPALTFSPVKQWKHAVD